MQTCQNILDFFYSAVQDTEASQSFFSNTQAKAWANEALEEMAEYTQYFDLVQTQDTVSGTATYLVGENGKPPFGVWRVEIDDEPIFATTQDDLYRGDRSWQSRSGKPFSYYLDNIDVIPDYYRIGLYDEPSSVYELRTYSYGVPATVDTAADYIHVPRWAIYGVLWYMLSQAYEAETRRQNMDTAAFYRELYDSTLEQLRGRSYGKTSAKHWVVGGGSSRDRLDFSYNLPDTIPEP